MNTESKAYWSEGNQIFFVDELAYGLTPDGRTVCIGEENEILKALKGESTGNLNVDNIIKMDFISRGATETTLRKHQMHRRRLKRFN